MKNQRVIVLGAGGMAREVVSALRALNRVEERFEFIGYAVTDRSLLTDRDSTTDVRGDYDWLSRHRREIDAFVVGIGSPAARLRVATEIRELLPHAECPCLIHPSAILDKDSATVSDGVFIGAGVVGTINLVFGAFALCNFGCTIGHEAHIGRGSVINPGANISGGVIIEDGVLVGTGAQILQYRTIGTGAIVGAGAVVTKDVSPGTTVLGIPARPLATFEFSGSGPRKRACFPTSTS